MQAGEFFEESKPEPRSLALKRSDHCLIDILAYVTGNNDNLLKIRGELPRLA